MAIIYCDVNATGANDGSDWEDAYTSLQTAISAGSSGDDVWVKEGTFTLTAAITCADGVDIFGGFDSALTGTQGSVAGRNLAVDITIIDGVDTYRCIEGADCRIDGFTIQNAYGTGVYCLNDDTEIYNCIIKDCDSGDQYYDGGGIRSTGTGSLVINNTTIDGCTAYTGAGIYDTTTSLTITDSIIKNNISGLYGGGLYSSSTSATISITDTEFYNNETRSYGGGSYTATVSLTVTRCHYHYNDNDPAWSGNGSACHTEGGDFINCIFNNNHADGRGVFRENSTNNLRLINCVIADNTCNGSDGVAIIATATSDVDVINTIVYDNTPSSTPFTPSGGITEVRYSCIEGGWSGTGNISSDPQFVGSGDDPYNIASNSPCIDAGDGDYAPTTDYLGNSRVDDPSTSNTGTGTPAYTDIGAYEFQPAVGWADKIYGISNANVGKIDGVSKSNIAKVLNG